MKKTLFTLAIVLLAVSAQAQTALKVHSNGVLSIQSASTTGGVQFQTNGYTSFEPSNNTSYSRLQQVKPPRTTSKCWIVYKSINTLPYGDVFYVTGNGDVYYNHSYSIQDLPRGRGYNPIANASELVSQMKGYYCDSEEFSGDPEDLTDNENVLPEAVEALLNDMEKSRSVVMNADELEAVLPEAVRHDPDGKVGINYNAIVPVLIEAFKEQQAKIEQMETVLRENGLLR